METNNRKLIFLEKAKSLHGDKYEYSKVIYVNAFSKICIICPIHGEFFIKPNNHINGKQGCKLCGIKRRKQNHPKTTEQFISDAQKIHGDKYDYSMSTYIKNRIKIKIRCKKCGNIFEQTPNSHLCQKSGCVKCNKNKEKSFPYLKNTTQICKQCGVEKLLNNFSLDNENKKYRYYRKSCKACEAANKKIYRMERMDRNKNRLYHRIYDKKRRKIDSVYKLRKDIPSIIRRTLNGNKGNYSVWNYLPYSPAELKSHLEKQFSEQMSWKNHGVYWHIDHIIPQSAFVYTSFADPNFVKCWSLSNLRPLESSENLRKGATFNGVNYRNKSYER